MGGQECGPIVGRGGENLSRLRREYGIDVQMPPGRTVDRVFMIMGSLESCLCAVKDVLQFTQRAPFPVGGKSGNEVEVNILVETGLVGHILGKSGSKIREIREQSETHMKVYQECLPQSNERVVAVGCQQPEQIVKCLQLVYTVLSSVERTSSTAPCYYQPGNIGNTVVAMSTEYPSKRQTSQPLANNTPVVSGESVSVGVAVASDFLNALTETKITVTNDMCGAIIGKGGWNVSNIRNVSGALITFSGEGDQRVISLAGTQGQVQCAEQMLTQSCVANMRK